MIIILGKEKVSFCCKTFQKVFQVSYNSTPIFNQIVFFNIQNRMFKIKEISLKALRMKALMEVENEKQIIHCQG